MAVTVTLAYYDTAITGILSFIVQATRECTIKPFTAEIVPHCNKLECLSLTITSALV